MKKLGFVCPWGKNREISWSGTHFGLYSSLQKFYDVIDIDTGRYANKTNPLICSHRCLTIVRKLFHIPTNDMGLSRMKIIEKSIKRKLKYENFPVLQFEECPMSHSGAQFIYIDLHAEYVKKLFDEDKDVFSVSAFQTASKKTIYRRAEQQAEFLKTAAGILTMGKWLADELVNFYGIQKEKVHHVGGGINIDVSRIDSSQKCGNKILFVGRDFIRKGGPLVLSAFQKARAKRNDIELYIAGPDHLDLKNFEGVRLLGDISYQELAEYFNKCDIFCMPSIFEAYGIAFIEALAFGLPCIARKAYEMQYFIEDGKSGFLLEDDNPDKLANMMLDLLSDIKIKAYVKSRREWYINEYSWNTVAERIKSVIDTDG